MAFIKSLFYKFTGLFINEKPIVKVSSAGWQDEWSAALTLLIKDKFEILKSAKDIEKIRPDFHSLSKNNQIDVLVEFIKALCFFESGYNPKSASVDVGTAGNKDTWSVGLLQMSVTDQSNYGVRFGYTFQDLEKPIPNLTLGVAVLAKQVQKRGKILIPRGESGVYWAVIHPGGKYDRSASIIAHVKGLNFEQPPPQPPIIEQSEAPWYDVALGELGVTEVRGGENKRIIEYHSATTLKAKEDEISWCASFVCWCLKQAGYKHTASAWARDYLNYGTKCEPKKGCIMVFERGSKGGTSHVTFYAGEETADSYLCFGGNQGDEVCFKYYAKSDLLGTRWPVR